MDLTVALLVATTVHVHAGGGFLAHLPLTMTRNVSDPNFRRAVFAELEAVLGGNLSDSTKKRVDDIEDVIRPMFVSMQKHANGKLDKNAVKYVLRRLFIKRQGWVIEGLEPKGETNSILGETAPLIMQDVIKKHIGVGGARLHEVAVIAAMMEHLIFEETVGKLVQAYKAKQISTDAEVSRAQAEDLVLLHMAAFIRARDVGEWAPRQVRSFQRAIYTLYPHSATIVPSMSALFDVVTPRVNKFKFDHVASVASEASKEFAQWQNNMCQTTFDHLLEIRDGQTGRVRLVDFYHAALHKGRYQFTETITYLRQLGTLDESDETNPRVIIPNYLLGRSNCVARTSYYSVCCLDDCEVLFSALERSLPKAFATSNEIIKAAQDISYASRFSETYADGFSEDLRRRLEEVAAHHDGLIPLHGRLFAQWMHLAFPQECPYPHKAGTVYYSSMENWEKESGQRSGSTLEEIEKWSSYLSELAQNRSELQRESDADSDAGMWTMEEELVTAWQPTTHRNDFIEIAHSKTKLRWLAMASCGVCLTFISRKLTPLIWGKGMIDKRSVDKWSV